MFFEVVLLRFRPWPELPPTVSRLSIHTPLRILPLTHQAVDTFEWTLRVPSKAHTRSALDVMRPSNSSLLPFRSRTLSLVPGQLAFSQSLRHMLAAAQASRTAYEYAALGPALPLSTPCAASACR